MRGLIRDDFFFMLQREANVVETVQQTMSHKLVDWKFGAESLVVADFTFFEIDGDLIVVDLLRAAHHRGDLVVGEADGKESILGAVVGEDVGER